jgi:iduronate 2-sulfatase
MRTDKYRLTIWVDMQHPGTEPIAVELYDHHRDPDENINIAKNPKNIKLIRKLSKQIKIKNI